MIARILATTLALCLALPALADKVGTAMVGGRVVDLFNDGTWKYREAENSDCRPLSVQLSFCGSSDIWQTSPPPSGDTIAQYRFDDRLYAQYIIEELGSDAGMSLEFMREAVIGNAAAGSGAAVEDIPVLSVEEVTAAGYKGETIVYSAKFGTLPLVMMNTILIGDGFTLQAMTFEIGETLSDRQPDLHREFLSLTKVSE